MDHRGPEHHYDEVECPECGTKWQQGEIQPETVRNNCPECDYDLRSSTGGRPYRGQPSPTQSDMTERSTPLDGASTDRGGNPLGEGILAKSIIEEAKEEAEQMTSPTEPEGLGELHPVKDNTWKPGDLTSHPARDEMLASVKLAFEDDNELWGEVVNEFENAKGNELANEDDSTGKVAAAPWLENEGLDSDIPVEQLGWDIVEVIEPDKEILEAQNKYTMPMPEGITDNLHNALVELNAWVENPEENGKLRPYRQYWSVIRPKINKGVNIQIGVEDPHMADIINHIARTDDASALEKASSVEKEAFIQALLPFAGMAARALLPMAAKQILPKIAGPLMKGALRGVGTGMVQNLMGAGGQGAQQTNQAMQQAGMAAHANSHEATYGDEYEHPSSITRRIEDPVNGGIDPHQRTDESNDDWAYDMLDVNEIGSTNDPHGKDDAKERLKKQFASAEKNEDELSEAEEKAIKSFFDELPNVLDFFHSDESGENDPVIGPLHEILESVAPGYTDGPEMTPEAHRIILFFNGDEEGEKKESATNFGPEHYAPAQEGPEVVQNVNGVDTNPSQCSVCQGEGKTNYVDNSMTRSNNPLGLCEQHANDRAESGAVGPESAPMQVSTLPMNQVVEETNQLNAEQRNQQEMKNLMQSTGSNEQGPHTDEQQAAVAELLIEENREEEIPNMIENSHEYADELAEVQNRQPMLDEDVEDQPGPAQEQPMPNQGMPPGMPPMGAPSPADLGAPGPGMGAAPGVMASMLKSAFKHGADSIAGTCPKCDSHTTKMIKQDGDCKCHTCGHKWKDNSFDSADGHSSDLSSTAGFLTDGEDETPPYNPGKTFTSEGLGVDLKEEDPFYIGENEENPTWSTDWISELEEQYPQVANMSDAERHKFLKKRGLGDVPTGDLLEKKYVPEDIGKAASLDSFVEPEEEELEIDDSTHKWVDENGEPLQEGKEYEIYAHDYDIPDVGRVVEIKPDAIVYEIESDGGLRTTIEIDRKEADLNGYRFVESGVGSEENPHGIEENMDSKPVAVPGETTDLSTPHIQIGSSTKISFEDYDEALVTEAIEWLLSLDGPYVFNEFEGLSQEEYQDEILNMHPDTVLRATDQHYGGGLDQLARDAGIVNQDDNPEEGLSAFGKTAGRHYTPMEQRELIDEYGEARNADKLNLENTHYAQADDDYFLFGC